MNYAKAITSESDVKARRIEERRGLKDPSGSTYSTMNAICNEKLFMACIRRCISPQLQLQSMARVYIKRCMSMFVPPFARLFARSLARSIVRYYIRYGNLHTCALSYIIK